MLTLVEELTWRIAAPKSERGGFSRVFAIRVAPPIYTLSILIPIHRAVTQIQAAAAAARRCVVLIVSAIGNYASDNVAGARDKRPRVIRHSRLYVYMYVREISLSPTQSYTYKLITVISDYAGSRPAVVAALYIRHAVEACARVYRPVTVALRSLYISIPLCMSLFRCFLPATRFSVCFVRI